MTCPQDIQSLYIRSLLFEQKKRLFKRRTYSAKPEITDFNQHG